MFFGITVALLLAGSVLGQTAVWDRATQVSSPEPGIAMGWSREIGRWTVMRINQAGTGRLLRCQAFRSNDRREVLEFSGTSGARLQITFRAGDNIMRRFGDAFRGQYWVEPQRNGIAIEGVVIYPGLGIFSEPSNAPPLVEVLIAGQEMVISAAGTTLRFPLDGADLAMQAFSECSRGD